GKEYKGNTHTKNAFHKGLLAAHIFLAREPKSLLKQLGGGKVGGEHHSCPNLRRTFSPPNLCPKTMMLNI
uniref:Uncharacterized protein n=1 Tax=Strigops habroptila TaxID=2489341 RepID=A0A672UG83_STRHB